MAKLSLTDLINLQNEQTAVAALNANSAATETALENTLSRDGTAPNFMNSQLDMNSNRIINLPRAVGPTEPIRKSEFDAIVGFDPITLGTMAFENSNNVSITGGTISGIPSPTLSGQSANKAYVDGAIATAVAPAVTYLSFLDYGAKPATLGSGTVSTSGTAITGVGTSFTTQFVVGDRITLESIPITGLGFLTTQPLNADLTGNVPWGSLVTGFGGADFSALLPGDSINVPIYGDIGGGTYLSAGRTWPVNDVLSSTKLRSTFMWDPHVGGGSSYPYVIVNSNTGYVVFPSYPSLHAGDSITISNSGFANLNGTYTVNQMIGHTANQGTTDQSTVAVITTSSVSDGTYIASTLTVATASAYSFALTAIVTGGTAAILFNQAHGFTATDAFNAGDQLTMRGWTGGAINLNGTFLVSGQGSGEFPSSLVITGVSGVANGTYSEIGAVAGTTWTYTPKPKQATITNIADNTHMTVGVAFATNFVAGSAIWKTNDNYAAWQSCIAAAKGLGLGVIVPSLAKTPSTPDTRYYFENTPAVTGNADGRITNSDFSQEILFQGKPKFILNQVASYTGFEFLRGTYPKFKGMHIEMLHRPYWSPIIGTFPYGLHLIGCINPLVDDFTALYTRGQGLSVEFCKYPTMTNIYTQDSSGGVVLDNNVGFILNNVTVINSADEAISFYGAAFRNRETQSGIASNLYVRNGFHGIAASTCYGLNMSNIYLEGCIGVSLAINDDPTSVDPYRSMKNIFSNVLIRRACTLGPAVHINGQGSAVNVTNAVDTVFNNVHIRDSVAGDGFFFTKSGGNLTALAVADSSAFNIPGVGLYCEGHTTIDLNNVWIKDAKDIGAIFYNNHFVNIKGMHLQSVAKTTDGGTYGSNRSIAFRNNEIFNATGLFVQDQNNPSTGYTIYESGTTGRGLIDNITTDIASTSLSYSIGTPSKVFVKGNRGSDVTAASTITLSSQVCVVSGGTTIQTISRPVSVLPGDYYVLIPGSAFTWGTSGNIRVSGTAVLGKALLMVWDGSVWSPSYV